MESDLKNLYPWCKQNEMYINQEELVDLIVNQIPHVVFCIFDSRDDDQIGGRVAKIFLKFISFASKEINPTRLTSL